MSTLHRPSRVESSRDQLETLESRTLLTATLPSLIGVVAPIPGPVTTAPLAPVTTVPVTIQAVAGAAFVGDVGMIRGLTPATLPLLKATINWGDSTPATAGVLSFDSAGVLHVQGQHTYAKAGAFPLTVSVIQNPPPGSMAPSKLYVINSKAQVSQNSVGGVTIHSVPNQPFSGVVGTFTFALASPVNYVLNAVINWGDGQSSVGKIVVTTTGAYSVLGTHTYAAVGTYRINIVVTARPPAGPTPTPTATPTLVIMVANILSTAIVSSLTPTA